jgi:predicted type IV restriction endonuclease
MLDAKPTVAVEVVQSIEEGDQSKIVTTQEELDGYNIVKAILRQKLDVKRIVARDTQSYFGVLLDDNNRKPLCRLHFNAKQKYLGVFDAEKNETRHPIEGIDDIFAFSEALLITAALYD